jgi:hypothetical protein
MSSEIIQSVAYDNYDFNMSTWYFHKNSFTILKIIQWKKLTLR